MTRVLRWGILGTARINRALIAPLRERFPTWEAVQEANPQAVIDAIRTAGLADQKGPRIQAALNRIEQERGALDLEFLRRLPPEQARGWLLRLHGVGLKTASIVLLFSLGMPAFPVDTHIYRVTGRMGLLPAGMTVDQAHDHLAAIIPPESYEAAHLNLIRLGREVCQARRPLCPRCPVRDLCDLGKSLLEE